MHHARRSFLLTALATSLALTAPARAQTTPTPTRPPLRLGLFPSLSPHSLFATYQPMRAYLEGELGQTVELQTAPDFATFTQRLLDREYDAVVAAPHLARLAQIDAGYVPLASYRTPILAYMLVTRDGPINKVADLRGKRMAVPDALALVGMMGEEMLRQAGIRDRADYRILYARSHNNAARLVLAGEADAAMVGSQFYLRLPPEQRGQFRVLAQSEPMAGQYILASPALGTLQMSMLLKALLAFDASPTGRAFFTKNSLGGVDAASGGELRSLDPYVDQVRAALAGKMR